MLWVSSVRSTMALVQGSKHDSTVIKKYKLQIEILVRVMVSEWSLYIKCNKTGGDQVDKYMEDVIHMAIIHISVK